MTLNLLKKNSPEFVEKVRNTMTWDDVVRVTNELYEYPKENESETDMSDHSMMSKSDSGDDSDDLDMDMEGEESIQWKVRVKNWENVVLGSQ